MKNKAEQTQTGIKEEDVECAQKKEHNCEYPEIDNIVNFCFYYLNTERNTKNHQGNSKNYT